MKQWLIAVACLFFTVIFITSCSSVSNTIKNLTIPTQGQELVCGPSTLFDNISSTQTTGSALSTPQSVQPLPPVPQQSPPISQSSPSPEAVRKIYKEGDLVQLQPNVTDPDKDTVTITFTAPLNAQGEWQTKKGDAGIYNVTITATDGKNTSKKTVLLVIEAFNLPPVITAKELYEFNEGDTVNLNIKATDPENKPVLLSYSAPLDNLGGWKSGYNDAGNYTITLTANDTLLTTTKMVKLILHNKNRAPMLDPLKPITVKEGAVIAVTPQATDADGDPRTFTFTQPLNSSGQWQTKVGDAGVYTAKVIAHDATLSDEKPIIINVTKANHAPVIEYVKELTATEGDNIVLTPTVTDADGDNVAVIYTPPFSAHGEWQTDYSSAGTHEVTITANDGKEATGWKVKLIVKDKNRPPEIVI